MPLPLKAASAIAVAVYTDCHLTSGWRRFMSRLESIAVSEVDEYATIYGTRKHSLNRATRVES